MFKKYKLTIFGVVIGGILGYLYYLFIGCASGTCKITSNPIYSTLYGSFMGGIIFSMFEKKSKTNNG